jgi:hypothetical protein
LKTSLLFETTWEKDERPDCLVLLPPERWFSLELYQNLVVELSDLIINNSSYDVEKANRKSKPC